MATWRQDDGEFTPRVLAVLAVAVVLALVVGLAAGTFIGRSSSPELAFLAGQARDRAVELRDELAPAGPAYAAAVDADGVADPEGFADARARLDRTGKGLRSARAQLEALSPGAYGRAVAAVDAASAAADRQAPPAEAVPLIDAAVAALDGLAG
jgi:hypothetical protein